MIQMANDRPIHRVNYQWQASIPFNWPMAGKYDVIFVFIIKNDIQTNTQTPTQEFRTHMLVLAALLKGIVVPVYSRKSVSTRDKTMYDNPQCTWYTPNDNKQNPICWQKLLIEKFGNC